MQATLFAEAGFQKKLKDHKGRRKSARPLLKSKPFHLILKSRYILLSHRHFIEERIQAYAKKFGIKIHQHAISPDHIHFAIQIPHRDYYRKFIRALTGVIARKMGKGMWKLLPFTDICTSRHHFRNLLAYIQRNHDETWLLTAYKSRRYSRKERERLGSPATLAPGNPNALG